MYVSESSNSEVMRILPVNCGVLCLERQLQVLVRVAKFWNESSFLNLAKKVAFSLNYCELESSGLCSCCLTELGSVVINMNNNTINSN